MKRKQSPKTKSSARPPATDGGASAVPEPRGSERRPQSMSDRQDLAGLLTLLDDGDPRGMDRLAAGNVDRMPYIVGITGAAGVGKSLLLSRILGRAGGNAQRVGVLAVDPTSPVTGGALLGDRIRMPKLPAGVFLRSVATRGGTGGLSEKLIDMAAAMKMHGYDDVFIETVGIGQDEWAVRQVADTLIVVEAPGMGDEIQAMKASPLAAGDILVVNKSDRPGARETAAIISETLGKKTILVSALEGAGVDELLKSMRTAKITAMNPQTKKVADRAKLAWRLTQAMARKSADRMARQVFDIVETADGKNAVPFFYRRIQEILSRLPDHVAIAVPDIETAIADYQKLGFSLERRETFPNESVETAFFNAGGFHIELLQSTSPAGPISKFVAERGGGLHHIAFEVEDIQAEARNLKSRGIGTIGGIRPGTRGKHILFLHPKSACRTLIEFCACDRQDHGI